MTTVSLRTSFLKPLIPVPVRRTCARAAKLSPDFYESFTCRPGHGADTAQYNLVARRSADDHRSSRSGCVPRASRSPGGKFTTGGDCSIGENAVQYWVRRNKKGGHEQATPSTPFSEIRGAVLCHHDQDRGWIEWTDNRLNVYSVASGRNRIALYEWWATEAGPKSLARLESVELSPSISSISSSRR